MPRRSTRAALIATPLAAFALLSPATPTPSEPAALPVALPAADYSPAPARLPDDGLQDTPPAPAPEQPAPEHIAPEQPAGAPVESAGDRVIRNAMEPAPRPPETVSIAPGVQEEIDRLNDQPRIELGTITPPPPEPFDPNHP
ncbi:MULTISPECIES: hypothetical protein [unclassified Saccharothrix]|uniref:hypothetical protein n=1 Tax=unclassified Saccharothrix TaxID=2593673 RepID=UPI00307F79F1